MPMCKSKLHELEDQVFAALAEDDNIGFCLECGSSQYGVEPDAENYRCEACGEHCVFGVEQILLKLGV